MWSDTLKAHQHNRLSLVSAIIKEKMNSAFGIDNKIYIKWLENITIIFWCPMIILIMYTAQLSDWVCLNTVQREFICKYSMYKIGFASYYSPVSSIYRLLFSLETDIVRPTEWPLFELPPASLFDLLISLTFFCESLKFYQ